MLTLTIIQKSSEKNSLSLDLDVPDKNQKTNLLCQIFIQLNVDESFKNKNKNKTTHFEKTDAQINIKYYCGYFIQK